MNSPLTIVASLAGFLAMQAGGMDMAAAQKWGAAKVVRYRVEGVHSGRVPVVWGDYEGKADVTDHLTLEFTWDVKKSQVVSPVTVTDGKTELKNIRSDGTNCPPPQLKAPYEHFQSVSSSMLAPDHIQIKGTRTYPPAAVSNYPGSCSMRSISGHTEDVFLWLRGVAPEALAMPIVRGGPLAVSADRKSFTVPGAEHWAWTFTPTLVQ
jgi:hypothetical protein